VQLTPKQSKEFQELVLRYYHEHGRHTLPWRTTHTSPYHVLVSEIMLQQTQVDRVIPKFLNFINIFSTIQDLATAPQSVVLTHWVGLGYNRRARMLHQAAQMIVTNYGGIIPKISEELLTLPGIGPYAAASIPAFAYNLPTTVLDTNIRAIYIHHFFADKSEKVTDKEILSLVKATLYTENPREWYSALMDYGTYLKSIGINPIKKSIGYTKQSKFVGSTRQLRGAILRELTHKSPQSIVLLSKKLIKEYKTNQKIVDEIIAQLQKEKFISIIQNIAKIS